MSFMIQLCPFRFSVMSLFDLSSAIYVGVSKSCCSHICLCYLTFLLFFLPLLSFQKMICTITTYMFFLLSFQWSRALIKLHSSCFPYLNPFGEITFLLNLEWWWMNFSILFLISSKNIQIFTVILVNEINLVCEILISKNYIRKNTEIL